MMILRRLIPFLLIGLIACGGGTLMSTASALSLTAPQDAYTCASEQFKKLGYKVTAHDDASRRLVAERENPAIKEPSGLFKRGFDRLEVTAQPDASGKTAVVIKAQSFKESLTARGMNQDEIEVTNQARADSKAIFTACAPS